LHDRATNHHPYSPPRSGGRRTWLEPQSRSSPATPFWTLAKHTTSSRLSSAASRPSPPTSSCMYLRTYVRGHSFLVATPHASTHPVASFARQPRRGGRNMQIREINARKFHYNSTRKISSSSCNLPPSLPPPRSLRPLVTTLVLARLCEKRRPRRSPSCCPFRTPGASALFSASA